MTSQVTWPTVCGIWHWVDLNNTVGASVPHSKDMDK
jgi:hypothetical protein